LRHALLAIVLVIAAFLGGALVNGPGLDWVMSQLSVAQDGETAAEPAEDDYAGLVESSGAAPSGEAERSHRPSKLPISPRSRLSSSPITDPLEPTWPPRRTDSVAASKADSNSRASRKVEAPGGPTVQSLAPDSETTSSEDGATAQRGEGSGVAAPEEAAAAASPGESRLTAGDRTGPWSDAQDTLAPAHAVLPDPDAPESTGQDRVKAERDARIRLASSQSERTEAVTPDHAASPWERFEARMEALEVGRYWIEGVPGGDVRFRCLVPVVGEGAVSQHFEAEAPTTAEAVEAALRRIQLWKTSLEAAQANR